MKHRTVLDYRQSIIELDMMQSINLKLCVLELR
jgi:hypothetical protein